MESKIIIKLIVQKDASLLVVGGDITTQALPYFDYSYDEDPAKVAQYFLSEILNSQKDINILDIKRSEAKQLTIYYFANIGSNDKDYSISTQYSWQKLEKLNNNIEAIDREVLEELYPDREVVKKTNTKTEYLLYTDGGSRGNPGHSALGYVIYDKDENVVKRGSRYLGITTNNQAEYQAVKEGLEQCMELGAEVVEVRLDSQLVANQMNGIYKIKNRDLWPIHESINKLSKLFKGKVKFQYIPRELNKEADSMVNLELDNYLKKTYNG